MTGPRATLLGVGGSGGVPQLGGADGRGDWGACDPGEPRNRRSRSSAVLRGADGTVLLVDAGPDLRSQLLRAGVGRVDAVLLTHAHADHVMGLDEVRVLNRLSGRAMPLLGSEATLREVSARFEYAFQPATPGFYRPALVPEVVSPGGTLRVGGLEVSVFAQDHGVTETLGLRCGTLGYSTDVVRMPEAGFAALDGVRTWVVGCFQRAPHAVHAHLDLALAWAARVGARRTVLTHMGPDLDWAWMRGRLPAGVEAGWDGMELEA